MLLLPPSLPPSFLRLLPFRPLSLLFLPRRPFQIFVSSDFNEETQVGQTREKKKREHNGGESIRFRDNREIVLANYATSRERSIIDDYE